TESALCATGNFYRSVSAAGFHDVAIFGGAESGVGASVDGRAGDRGARVGIGADQSAGAGNAVAGGGIGSDSADRQPFGAGIDDGKKSDSRWNGDVVERW